MRVAPAILLVLMPAVLAGQSAPETPAATLRGRVVSTADNTPLSRARLVLTTESGTQAPVHADATGAFVAPVPGGAYRITVTKAGYAPLRIDAPREPDRPLLLAMTPGAIIRGRLSDPNGDPVVDAAVQAIALGGGAPAASGFIAQTDDRGEFRIGNLPAGRYDVRASRGIARTAVFTGMPAEIAERLSLEAQQRLPSLATAQVTAAAGEEVAVMLVQAQPAVSLPYASVGGVLTGTLADEFGEPAEGASVQLWITRFVDGRLSMMAGGAPRTTDDTGRFRLFHIPAGRYILAATPAGEPPLRAAPMYLPVYYPGRFDATGATVVQVDPGIETPGLDMTVTRSRGARVFGVAMSAGGTPLDGEVRLVPTQSSGAAQAAATLRTNTMTAGLAARPAADGSFELRGVPPGHYAVQAAATLTTRDAMRVSDRIEGLAFTRMVLMSHTDGISEFTMQRHAIVEGDYGPLALTTIPTATLRGSIAVDGPRQRIAPAEFAFTVVHADPDELPAMLDLRPEVTLQPDGRFEITGLTGRGRIALTRAPPGWWLKSVDVGGTNAATTPVAFDSPAASRDDVTIVLAPTAGTIEGRVGGGTDAPGASVVVFAVDRDRRMSGSRYIRSTAIGADRSFSLNSFPPGVYYVVAVEEASGDWTGDWENPEQLDVLAPLAERVTLGEGGTVSLELTLRTPPR